MAEYRYYLIPDAMTRAFPEQFGKQTPTEFFDNIADLEKRYHQLREMPYNNERTWNERTRFPYARLVVGIDRQNPDGAVAIIQVRNGVNYLCDDYRGPYADRSDAQIPQMAKKLVEVIGVDRVRPHTYTQRDGYTWVQVEKDTSRISLCLGGYVQAAAEPLLDELGHEVMQLARDSVAIQAEPVHNTDTQSPTQTTSREEAVTDDVHEREGLSDSEPELAESQENQPEPVRQDAAGLLGAERAEPVRPDDAGGNAAVELPQDGAGCAADGGQDAARSDAESADARPQDEPSGLGTDVQQPEAAGGGNDPSDAVRSITEEPAAAESEPSPSAFSLPEFPAELLPFLLKADTTSRASNADILSFFSKTPLLIDRLRYIRESYKVVFTELLLDDDTRVGFYKESNGLLLWQGSYLTRSAESHLSWHSVTAAINKWCSENQDNLIVNLLTLEFKSVAIVYALLYLHS